MWGAPECNVVFRRFFFIMKKAILALILAISLSSCNSVTQMPIYVVMLTTEGPMTTVRCTGVMVDPETVITAGHCSELTRVVTQGGSQAGIRLFIRWMLYDIAIMKTDKEIHLGEYAEFGSPTMGSLGTVWGVCPYYFSHTIRRVFSVGEVHDMELLDGNILYSRTYDYWKTAFDLGGDRRMVCGGDSGGAVVQNGKVVGITSAIHSEHIIYKIGNDLFAVNGETVKDLIGPFAD